MLPWLADRLMDWINWQFRVRLRLVAHEISATYGKLALVGQPAAALLRSKP